MAIFILFIRLPILTAYPVLAGSVGDNTFRDPSGYQGRSQDSGSEDLEPFIRRRRRKQPIVSDVDKHQNQYEPISDDSTSESEDESFDDIAELKARPQDTKQLDSIRAGDFVYPPSQYEGYIPPVEVSKERDVIKEFMEELKRQKSQVAKISDEKDFFEFDLNHFSIYLPDSVVHYPGTMTGLQNLATKTANSWYCFDGILSLGMHKRYVQGVSFKLCSIGNYGRDVDSVGNEMWIQSDQNHRSDIYYRLKAPSDEYSRYHEGFVWLANLAKHFVDYLEHVSEHHMEVSIHNFKADFVSWLEKTHGTSPNYQGWYNQYGRRDFRGHVSANIEFLWKETNGISEKLLNHPIWKEVKSMDFIPMQELRAKGTVVTPYVYDCFKHLRFGGKLSNVAPSSGVQYRRKSLGRTLQLTTDVSLAACPLKTMPQLPVDKKAIDIGDVLGVPMDGKGMSLWKDEASKWKTADDCWYVLVQGVHIDKCDLRSFDIIWLYKPSDTTCAKMKYPYSKELFLSDNCSCDTQRITEGEVLCKISIDWNGLPGVANSDFFIRQTYLRNNSFVTLKECHKRCIHLRDEVKTPLQELVDNFKVGDTVLYAPPPHLKPKYSLEPGEIVEFLQRGSNGFVIIRRLPRRHDLDGEAGARPNELVYSNEICTVPASKVTRKCFVRFYTLSEVQQRAIPPPYNRDGTGDAFYITTRVVREDLEPVHTVLPLSLIQGPDFRLTPPQQRLNGLDLYCGGGNFGRGLEEGGFVRNTHAVDLDGNAIHTYWANLENKEATKLFYGSVNDMLGAVLDGNPSKSSLIPLPGDIDFISAGSPCPGFSILNSRRDNAQGLQNQSLVASVAAYIDVFRPKYALLENVITMAQKGKGRDEDVLSQLICCIVGMGYQVQVFNLDAWSFGSPQSRSRLFVSIAAPGLEPPPHPNLSHSHPDGTKERGLGLMASGHSFGERLFKPTPFEYVTAQEATVDLPDIGDGRTYHCTGHPDHRMARGIPRLLKSQIEIIPINPRGMNFARTLKQGLMTRAERHLFPTLTKGGRPCHNVAATSKGWERVHPRKLFPTIATSASPGCARTGRCLHWDQQRLITVLEARRAQSFPDDEVITGLQAKQWRIIGNSVARTVSLALGQSIGEACRKNLLEEQKSNPVDIVFKETRVSDVDSTMNSFVSPVEGFDKVSTDSAVRSERLYNHALYTLGLKSPANGDDTSSTSGSTNSSDEPTIQAKRRRHNISADTTPTIPEKSMRTPGPASTRGRKIPLEPGQNMIAEDDTTGDSEELLRHKSPTIHTERPSWQRGQQGLSRTSRAQKQELFKQKKLVEDINEPISSEYKNRQSSRSRPEVRASLQSTQPAIQLQKSGKNPTKSDTVFRSPSIHKEHESALKRPRRSKQIAIKPISKTSPPATMSKQTEVILLDSDSENVGAETEDSDDNPVFVSATKRKRVQTYVPVDNTMFMAYQRTHETMRPGARWR
jgi:DNA (cytosine-5)-methyltransferase 1